MTDGTQPPRKFTIRRISPETPISPPPAPPPAPKPPASKPQSSPTPPKASVPPKPVRKATKIGTAAAGQFRRANSVLAFVSSVLNSNLAEEITVRQMPDRDWWVEVPIPYQQVTTLIWASGGRPFTNSDDRWVEVSLAGEVPTQVPDRNSIDTSSWAVVDLSTLLAEVTLLPGRYNAATMLDVLVPAALSRWVLRRATGLGLNVTILQMSRQPLKGNHQPDSRILLLRLQSQSDRKIPNALVHSLTQLPYAIVGEPLESEGKTLMIDVRHRLPLVPSLVQQTIPKNEYWALGSTDAGHWRLQPIGEPINGDLLLETTELPMTEIPALPSATLPPPLPVQLVRQRGNPNRVDAVLLDEQELTWLRPFLIGRPLGEAAFLLPGSGYYLLTAPGGLPGAVPFGVPLVQVGPGALYLELGCEFSPPLPDGARQERFQLSEQSAIVLTPTGVFRFEISNLIPAWTLWIGEAPPIQSGLSAQGERLLNSLSRELRQAAAKQAEAPKSTQQPVSRSQRVQLLEQAQRAELAGNLVQAAELLERAGYPGPAGRLYERAATRSRT